MNRIIPYYLSTIPDRLGNWFIMLMFFWLIDGPRRYWKKVFGLILGFEDTWATFITLRYFFRPLYQDYTIIGRIIGPFFRLFRIIIGIMAHLFLLTVSFFIFLGLCLVFWGAPLFFLINLFIWNQ